MKRKLAVASLMGMLFVPLSACGLVGTSSSAGEEFWKLTCEELADEAVAASASLDSDGPDLLKVRQPVVVSDIQETFAMPTGTDEVDVLTCTGMGVYSDNVEISTDLVYSVDADGDTFYSWRS